MDGARLKHFRETYFALVRELGISDEDRHAFNRALTGRESTTTFTEQDWLDVIAELQRLNGQDAQPGHPRLRLPLTEHERAMEQAFLGEGLPVDAYTDAQCRFIDALAKRVAWREENGLELLIRARVLNDEVRQRLWHGTVGTLSRDEAGLLIRILLRMAGDKKERPRKAHAGAV